MLPFILDVTGMFELSLKPINLSSLNLPSSSSSTYVSSYLKTLRSTMKPFLYLIIPFTSFLLNTSVVANFSIVSEKPVSCFENVSENPKPPDIELE